MPDIRYAQNENVDRGDLRMQVIERGTSTPIDDAKISISYSGDPDSTVEEVNTDASGMSETLTLDTPPLELSMQPSEVQPYAEYTIQVTAKGYRPINISGIEVFSGQLSLQEIRMDAEKATESMTDNIVIPAHTLFAEYPPKIAEAEIKPVTETGEIVLSRVVIPEYVIVHDGAPSDPTARDYYVRYRDYIKNVASSEIYSTWPDATIRANVLAIMSFTLNRVYTEWYRNKGYSFTITSSTAYDQKFMYGRNIYQSISDVVDEMFQNYLSRPNVRQPILTQYCDGHGDLGDLGQRLGIGVAVVAAAVEGVRRHSGDDIGHAILGIGAGQSDLAAQAGLIVADDGRGLGVFVKHLVVEHPGLAAVYLSTAGAKAAGIGMRFSGNDLGAARILAHGAVGAVTVVGVLPVVAGSRRIGGVGQAVADRTGNREIVA